MSADQDDDAEDEGEEVVGEEEALGESPVQGPTGAFDPEVFEELKARENERIKRTGGMGYVFQNMMNALASRTTNDPLDVGTLIATIELWNRVYGIWGKGELAPLVWVTKERPRTHEELENAVKQTREFFDYAHKLINEVYSDYLFAFEFINDVDHGTVGLTVTNRVAIMNQITKKWGFGEENWASVKEHLRRTMNELYPFLIETISSAMKDVNQGRPVGRGYTLSNL